MKEQQVITAEQALGIIYDSMLFPKSWNVDLSTNQTIEADTQQYLDFIKDLLDKNKQLVFKTDFDFNYELPDGIEWDREDGKEYPPGTIFDSELTIDEEIQMGIINTYYLDVYYDFCDDDIYTGKVIRIMFET